MEDSIGKDFVMGHYQGETKISIAGTHANDIFEFYQRRFCFQKEGMPAGALLTVQFGEMESCTDDVLIGVFAVAHVGKFSLLRLTRLVIPRSMSQSLIWTPRC